MHIDAAARLNKSITGIVVGNLTRIGIAELGAAWNGSCAVTARLLRKKRVWGVRDAAKISREFSDLGNDPLESSQRQNDGGGLGGLRSLRRIVRKD